MLDFIKAPKQNVSNLSATEFEKAENFLQPDAIQVACNMRRKCDNFNEYLEIS